MSTSLMFVVLACCCFGEASGQITANDAVTLTIEYTATQVVFKCTSAGTTGPVAADSLAITKGTDTVKFETKVQNTAYDFTPADKTATWTVPKASHTIANYGSYTCQMKSAAVSGNPVTKTSLAVVLPACSSAPRTVDSLALALVCLLATVVKSKLC